MLRFRWISEVRLSFLVDIQMTSIICRGTQLIRTCSVPPVRKIGGLCSGMHDVGICSEVKQVFTNMLILHRKSVYAAVFIKGLSCPDKLLSRWAVPFVCIGRSPAVFYDIWKRE